MIKGSFISKNESVILQGIAVMLMVYHHLFGFPERISCDYTIVSDFSFLHIGTMISYFGRICISVFAFNSGYGMYKKLETLSFTSYFDLIRKSYLCVLKQIKNFYIRYWIVFIAFVPFGFAINRYSFDLKTFLLTLIGYSPAYNAEWWYIKCYIVFLIFFPLLYLFDKIISNSFGSKAMAFIYFLMFLLTTVITYFKVLTYSNIGTYMCFVSGVAFVSLNIFDKVFKLLLKLRYWRFLLSFIFISFLFVIKMIIFSGSEYDYLLAPLFIFSVCVILKSGIMQKSLNKLLLFIGKYSMYVWLIHTFFAYYYFQSFLYSFKYSTIIFIVCMVCTIALGFIFEWLANKIIKLSFIRSKKAV